MPTQIIITDVTLMKRGEVCVAGWCPDEGRMIRPLRGGARFWNIGDANPKLFAMGNVVELSGPMKASGRDHPHAHEDGVLPSDPKFLRAMTKPELVAALQPSASPSVEAIFGPLAERRFVLKGTTRPSLGAVDTGAKQIGFKEVERDGEMKLRCWFFDRPNADRTYDFPVASKELRDIWKSDGLDALNALKVGSRRAHVRIGLAGDLDDACYAMVNNVLFY